MKVYELINELSKLPAGAEVEFSMVMATSELKNNPAYDTVGGENLFSISEAIKELELIDDTLVVLLR